MAFTEKIKHTIAHTHFYTYYKEKRRNLLLRNVNKTSYKNKCLLVYITQPFYHKKVSSTHQNIWQARELARIIGEFHYNVDVVDYRVKKIHCLYTYDMVIGLIPRGTDCYSGHLKENAVKIAYLTSSNIEFTNRAEKNRLQELYNRRGCRLSAYRQGQEIEKSIEKFDGALFFGNTYNVRTYRNFSMPPLYFIKNNGSIPDRKIAYSGRRANQFLFLGSVGQVHKGLDLLLEMFSEPDFPCELYICGSYEKEKDFCDEFRNELFECPNIHPMGFVDIQSECFYHLAEVCSYMIMPSCAEGQAGSVITAMSVGLIPIVSCECGFDKEDVILLDDCRPETIRHTVLYYSNQSSEWLMEQYGKESDIARTKFSKEAYTSSIYEGLSQIIGNKKWG